MSVILKPTLGSQPNLGHILMPDASLWLFNEGSGNKVFDLSGNGNIGTFVGSLFWTVGKYGPMVEANGSTDSIDFAAASSVLQPDSFTIVAGIKPDDTAAWQSLIGWGGEANFPAIYLDLSGKPIIYMGSGNFRYFVTDAWTTLADGKEHIVVFTLGGSAQTDISNSQMFIDGVSQAVDSTNTSSAQEAKTTNRLLRQHSRYFDGKCSFIYLYNRVLSASEIIKVSRNPFIMFERNPIELWVGATSVGVPPVGMAGAMTTNTGYWGW